MKSDRDRIIELLYRSFDDELRDAERRDLARALEESDELRTELEQIKQMRTRLAQSAPDSFGPFFAERVMNRLTATGVRRNGEDFAESLLRMFRPVALVGAAAVVLLLIFNLYTGDDFSLPTALGVADAEIYSLWETPLESMLGGS
ncbi:MAG: hypothetical protein ABIE70_03350 [bacterium]